MFPRPLRHFSRLSARAQTALLGLLTGLAGLLALAVPPLANLEADVGLDWLFRLRGPRPAPPQAVVVSIDRASSRRFDLPNVPRKWPRRYHADLVDRLTALGARAIVFDIRFSDPREAAGDAAFAAAMRRSGRVLLFEYLETDNGPGLHVERRFPPIEPLRSAALATAPFALPKVPEQIRQAWLYKAAAGSRPTLPVVALFTHCRSAWPALVARAAAAGLADLPPAEAPPDRFAQVLRERLVARPAAARRLQRALAAAPADGPGGQCLRRLAATLAAPPAIFLDYYGPPRAVRTLPYYQVVEGMTRARLDDATVFVGFSEQLQPEQKDGFYTAFTRADGLDISGVEIMATTFANLVEGRWVRPLPPAGRLATVLAFGLLAAALAWHTRGYRTLAATGALAAGWLALAWAAFALRGLWLPLTTPLLLQLPLALTLALVGHYRLSHRQQEVLRERVRPFLPPEVIDPTPDAAALAERLRDRELEAACLASDVYDYTRRIEHLSPTRAKALMDRYWHALFQAVHTRQGRVMDVAGDGMLALWLAEQGPAAACHDAAQGARAIAEWLAAGGPAALPTRLGLHFGPVALGTVGDGHQLQLRAVGDTVNTVSRIERANRLLGTRLLASAAVVAHLDGMATRWLGEFRLAGRTRPVSLYELPVAPLPERLLAGFQAALARYREEGPAAALAEFEALARRFQDGPSRFFAELCRHQAAGGGDDEWPVVPLGGK